MFELQDDNRIVLTRGDSLYLHVNITEDGEPYTLQDGDIVRFAMKLKYTDAECVVQKALYVDSNNNLVLHLVPSDTEELTFKKEYVYDIQITKSTGDVYTFISGKFYLAEEVE